MREKLHKLVCRDHPPLGLPLEIIAHQMSLFVDFYFSSSRIGDTTPQEAPRDDRRGRARRVSTYEEYAERHVPEPAPQVLHGDGRPKNSQDGGSRTGKKATTNECLVGRLFPCFQVCISLSLLSSSLLQLGLIYTAMAEIDWPQALPRSMTSLRSSWAEWPPNPSLTPSSLLCPLLLSLCISMATLIVLKMALRPYLEDYKSSR